jgi:hypothetical protein
MIILRSEHLPENVFAGAGSTVLSLMAFEALSMIIVTYRPDLVFVDIYPGVL